MRKAQALLLIVLAASWLMSCGPKAKIPDSQPLPAGQSWAGVWYSPQFEHMFLRQTGDAINGIYTYKYGGTIEGETNGNIMKFTWIDPGSKEEARRSLTGKGWFQLVKEDGMARLKGEWGYNDAMTGGGVWEAEFVRTMDADDPRNLEDWREEQGID